MDGYGNDEMQEFSDIKTRADMLRLKRHARSQGRPNQNFRIAARIPDTTCKYCQAAQGEVEADSGEAFDEEGYRILASPFSDASLLRRTRVIRGRITKAADGVFRFLDLPPELRNRICELVFTSAKQPVCIRDGLLRPADDLDLSNVLRECTNYDICLPCQLHQVLGTATSGLSRVNKQLHDETALVPYAINTFSVHNLYYLQAFLELIGDKGRKNIKSIHFKWRLPEGEAYSLGMVTSLARAYALLADCTALTTLEAEIDPYNLMSRKCNGGLKDKLTASLADVPSIKIMYELRGMQDIKLSWVRYEKIDGMLGWAARLIELWRTPRGSSKTRIPAAEKEVDVSVGGSIEYIHYRGRGFET